MRNLILAGVAAVYLCSTALNPAAAQSRSPVLQTQANPQGPGTPSATPPDPATAGSPVAPSMPADLNYNAGPYKGALSPPPPQAMNQTYPVCTSSRQDSCVNPGEVGSRIGHTMHHRKRHTHGY